MNLSLNKIGPDDSSREIQSSNQEETNYCEVVYEVVIGCDEWHQEYQLIYAGYYPE